MRRKWSYWLLVLLVVMLGTGGWGAEYAGDTILSFHSEIIVNHDTSVTVTETIAAT